MNLSNLEDGEINELKHEEEEEEGELDGQPVHIKNGIILNADDEVIGKMADDGPDMIRKWDGSKWVEFKAYSADDDDSVDGNF